MKTIIMQSTLAIILVSGIALMTYQRLHPTAEVKNTPSIPVVFPPDPAEVLPQIFNTTTTNTQPEQGQETISVAEAIGNANLYNNKKICIRGDYQSSFEFSAFGGSFNEANSLMKPWIWVEGDVDTTTLPCEKNSVGQSICRGTLTACGLYQAASTKDKGFGHMQAYQYQLSVASKATQDTTLQVE